MLNTAKLLIYEVILLLAKIRFNRQSSGSNTILLIKTDELGDYIVFRNYFEVFVNDYAKGKKIILVGNELWKNLYVNFDKHPSIIDTYWINKKSFKRDMLYRFNMLKKINRLAADTTINLVYSRTRRFEDAIASASTAKIKITYTGNADNSLPIERKLNKKLYNQLITVPQKLHDFLKHQIFFQQLTGKNILLPQLTLPAVSINELAKPPQPYVLIFPGSGKPEKIWETDKFVEVANFIFETYGYHICLCGSKADVPHAENFKNNFKHDVTDYCGKTNMMQVIALIQKCQFTVSIDTGSVHLSAACNIPAFAVYNGIHYGRFAPYPAELKKNVYPVYPDDVEMQLLRNSKAEIIAGKYNDVSATKVISSIQNFILKN